MNNLHRELAPISDAAWAQIEEEASRTLKRYFAARRVVDRPGFGGCPRGPKSTAERHQEPGVVRFCRRVGRPRFGVRDPHGLFGRQSPGAGGVSKPPQPRPRVGDQLRGRMRCG